MSPDPRTIPELIAHHHEVRGSSPIMVSDDDVLTFAALDERSRELARRLLGGGVGHGSRVALLMANGIEWAVAAMAVARLGAVLVPLSTLLRAPEIEAQLRAAGVRTLIAQPEYRSRRYLDELDAHLPAITSVGAGVVDARLPNLRRVWSSEQLPEERAPVAVADALERSVRPADDLVVMFTSGSRGTPKGVIHTHGGAIRATAEGLPVRGIGAGDRLYIPMPFFWMGGYGGGLLSVLVAGATLLTETEPTPASTIRFLERERATLFRGWPDQAARIAADPDFARADLSSLRPGSLDAVLLPELRAAPGARANLFGMTETFGPYAGSQLDTDMPRSAWGSCGRPVPGVEVRITDPDDGQVLAPGEHGVIQVRGPNVMRGICGRTRDVTFGPDGFYPTGDLGWLDADGYLFYAGRLDDMVKVSGATVYPTEVEAALRSLDAVHQAYVTDVPDADGTAMIGAVVVAVEGASIDEIDRAAREVLSSFKVPRAWMLAGSPADVPLLASGKVDKAGLQALIADRGVTATRA